MPLKYQSPNSSLSKAIRERKQRYAGMVSSFEVSSDYDGSSKERRDPKLSTKDQSEEREMEMKVKGKGTRRWDGGVWCEGE
jgi:hypothetical protein